MTVSFYSAFLFLNIQRGGVLTALFGVVARLVPRETAALSAQVLCTPYNMHQFTVSLHSKPHT